MYNTCMSYVCYMNDNYDFKSCTISQKNDPPTYDLSENRIGGKGKGILLSETSYARFSFNNIIQF